MVLKKTWKDKLLYNLDKICKNPSKYCKYSDCEVCMFNCREPNLDETTVSNFQKFMNFYKSNPNFYSDFEFLETLRSIFRKEN